jgi:ferredoxin, 2Fe-2S
MVKLTFVVRGGRRFEVETNAGTTARDAALSNNVPGIDGDCGGACACATCHVYVDPAWINTVGRLVEGTMESDLLQFAEGITTDSRLACQIILDKPLEGLVLHVPEQQY